MALALGIAALALTPAVSAPSAASATTISPAIWAVGPYADYYDPRMCWADGDAGIAQGRWREYDCRQLPGIYEWRMYVNWTI
ncbi:hypothetical protein GCM10009765_05150 [Fodinicola feengrottensis]|uniref:Uncharacterized protein n=2 Tax=Fodinicola feengrottensis TaxID=435914 RepID=A0ABN2FTK5_9ACTN